MIGQSDASAYVPAGGKIPESHSIGSMMGPRFHQGVCFYLGIGYLNRNSENRNVCLCMGHDFCKPTEMN